MSVFLGRREVKLLHLGAGHTAGDIVAFVPDAEAMFSGDLVEYRSACYCGDAHLREWPLTLEAIRDFHPKALVPGRGDALTGEPTVREARGRSLKETYAAVREAMDPKFASFAIYEHCLPFNVSRAYDEASGIDHPVIWTAERDRQMWGKLQG